MPVPSTTHPSRVGVLGAGTVGAALIRLLARHPEIEVTAALVRDLDRPRELGARPVHLTTDPEEVLDGADVVVELLGGVDRSTELMAQAAARGTRLVTANKAALAERWDVWGPWVRAGRVGFEAAVMAGTPVIGAVAGALRGSRLRSLEALLNGTCAYLIGELEAGVGFEAALAEAQRLGYAEADPALDVDGIDAAHKLTVLARLCADPDLAWAERPSARARGARAHPRRDRDRGGCGTAGAARRRPGAGRYRRLARLGGAAERRRPTTPWRSWGRGGARSCTGATRSARCGSPGRARAPRRPRAGSWPTCCDAVAGRPGPTPIAARVPSGTSP